MNCKPFCKFPEVKIIKPSVHHDNRGYFLELYQCQKFDSLGIHTEFVQTNHSMSHKNVIRGMHFQSGRGQAKLVYALYGEIFDVVVDIREDSPSFGKWEGIILNDQNHYGLYIPEGFAHGFAVLSEKAFISYQVNSLYDAEKEKGFNFNDPFVDIKWPIQDYIVSEKDLHNPSLKELMTCIG